MYSLALMIFGLSTPLVISLIPGYPTKIACEVVKETVVAVTIGENIGLIPSTVSGVCLDQQELVLFIDKVQEIAQKQSEAGRQQNKGKA